MRMVDEITLRKVVTTADSDGYPTTANTDIVVYANVKSVRRSEFYAANAASMRPSIVFEINPDEYDNQTITLYNGKVYRVIRAYRAGMGRVELTCAAG